MRVKQVNLISIDQYIYESIKMNGAYIQGIYKSTIHLSFNDIIITLGYHIGRGKHHILIDEPLEFNLMDIKINTKVEIINHQLIMGNLVVNIRDQFLNSFYPYQQIYQMTIEHQEVIENLKIIMIKNHPCNLFSYDHQDYILDYQFKRINRFLIEPNLENAQSILGLGVGLTPLGDDVLTGYILGKNTVGKSIEWIKDLLTDIKQKTNKLSAQNIEDTHTRYYPDIFIDMIESIFIEYRIDKAMLVLNLGSTSGAGILTGFIYGLI